MIKIQSDEKKMNFTISQILATDADITLRVNFLNTISATHKLLISF